MSKFNVEVQFLVESKPKPEADPMPKAFGPYHKLTQAFDMCQNIGGADIMIQPCYDPDGSQCKYALASVSMLVDTDDKVSAGLMHNSLQQINEACLDYGLPASGMMYKHGKTLSEVYPIAITLGAVLTRLRALIGA